MSDSYLIEVHDDAAGIVVRDNGQFRFFASHRRFFGLDGRAFSSPRDAERAAIRHIARKAHRADMRRGYATG